MNKGAAERKYDGRRESLSALAAHGGGVRGTLRGIRSRSFRPGAAQRKFPEASGQLTDNHPNTTELPPADAARPPCKKSRGTWGVPRHDVVQVPAYSPNMCSA